mgnify:CR=1 FL=1
MKVCFWIIYEHKLGIVFLKYIVGISLGIVVQGHDQFCVEYSHANINRKRQFLNTRLMFSRMKFIMIFLLFVCDQLIIQQYKEGKRITQGYGVLYCFIQ